MNSDSNGDVIVIAMAMVVMAALHVVALHGMLEGEPFKGPSSIPNDMKQAHFPRAPPPPLLIRLQTRRNTALEGKAYALIVDESAEAAIHMQHAVSPFTLARCMALHSTFFYGALAGCRQYKNNSTNQPAWCG